MKRAKGKPLDSQINHGVKSLRKASRAMTKAVMATVIAERIAKRLFYEEQPRDFSRDSVIRIIQEEIERGKQPH